MKVRDVLVRENDKFRPVRETGVALTP